MKVGAVVVIYNIEDKEVLNINNSIAGQLDCVCIVDNSDKDNSSLFHKSNINYVALRENKGLAFAQNVAIEYLLGKDVDFLFFCDQDSDIDKHLVLALVNSFNELKGNGLNIGGVGPRAFNKNTGADYPHRENLIRTFLIDNDHKITEVSYLMNSGSIIPSNLFKEVGLMDNDLFIDAVDSEWCWRARKKSDVSFYVDERIKMGHCLGMGQKRILGKTRSVTAGYRFYYQYRNYLWLCHRDYVPHKWKVYQGKKYFAKIFYYTFFRSNGLKNLSYMLRGIKDGLFRQNP